MEKDSSCIYRGMYPTVGESYFPRMPTSVWASHAKKAETIKGIKLLKQKTF